MLDDMLNFEDLADGGDRDDAPNLSRRDPTEYPDEGENPEDYEDWEEGEKTDDGEHDSDGEHPNFEDEIEEESKEEWEWERDENRGGESDVTQSSGSHTSSGISSMLTTAVVGIFAATVLFTPGVSSRAAEFNSLSPHGTTLDYNVHITMEYTPEEDEPAKDWYNTDTDMVLVAENSQESISVPLLTGNEGTAVSVTARSTENEEERLTYDVDLTFTGIMEGLVETHPYRVSVVGTEDGSTVTYCTQDLKTEEKVTEIRGFTGECTCSKDGNYNFWVDYSDENNYYSGFSYELVSPAGETVKSGQLDTLHGKQIISGVDKLEGEDYTLIIRIKSSNPVELEADNITTELGNGSSIVQDHGMITITENIKI